MRGGERAVGRLRRPTSGVVLAAGASAGFHGYPNALAPVGGVPAVRRIVTVLTTVGVTPIVVVAGPHAPEIRRAVDGIAVDTVVNVRWSAGRTGSVQVGLDRAPPGDDVVVWPVDHPFVAPSTVATLLDVTSRDPLALWIAPVFLGAPGQPIVLREEARAAVAALAPATPIGWAQAHLGPQVRRFPVDDPGVVARADDWESYREHLARWEAGRLTT